MMRKKAISDFSEDEKNWMDTVAVNYIIAQADGFQMGYAKAIEDFKESIVDYWNGSDDKPQESVLDTLVELGENLAKRKYIAKKNLETAEERGFENYYMWHYKDKDEPFGRNVNLFTKDFEADMRGDNNE